MEQTMGSVKKIGVELATMKDQLNPFIVHLFENESRIRLYDVGNDYFNDEKFFVVEKNYIHIPTQLPAVEHEIAHAVEMKSASRWTLPDWGLTFSDFAKDKPPTNSRFFAALARETRVRAIQLHMSPEHRNDKHSTMYSILNNEYAWGGYYTTRHLPYGRFKSYEDVEAWVHDLREKTYNAWSLNRIAHEWKIRLEAMQNWMES